MLRLLQAVLKNESMQPSIYTPTTSTVAIQLNYPPKGVIVDICQIDNGYSVKLFDLPAGQTQPKPVLKAMSNFLYFGDVNTDTPEYDTCVLLFDKHFGKDEQHDICNHVAGLLEDKKTKK